VALSVKGEEGVVRLNTERVLDPYYEKMSALHEQYRATEAGEAEVTSLALNFVLARAGVAALHYFYASERDREVCERGIDVWVTAYHLAKEGGDWTEAVRCMEDDGWEFFETRKVSDEDGAALMALDSFRHLLSYVVGVEIASE
jgi:hypothetical protein